MSTVITGLFKTATDAAVAIRTLEAKGVAPDRISVVANESFDKESFAVDTHSKLPEGAAIGAGAGGAVGALIAGFTAVGALATGPGVLVAGPLVAALAGAGAGAAGGSVLGGLIGLAIPEHEVKHYEDAIGKGAVLVGVECESGDDKDAVKSVFKDCNCDKISHA